ncbi:MAG TPA: nucleoside-diphosphate sugar epimerase/dehydratase [Bryobacteraceae bacterium]|nr:nucleoside-diphosphate sugar epimerase/dehydratase [Bryobacteraceae bacterium]
MISISIFYLRRYWIMAIHVLIIAIAMATAFLLRFDFQIPHSEMDLLYGGLLLAIPIKSISFIAARLNSGWWRFVGMPDLLRVFAANMCGSSVFLLTAAIVFGGRFPRSSYVIDFIVCFLLTAGARFAVRLYSEIVLGELTKSSGKRILIYGAGMAGMTLVRELRNNPALGEVVGFLDDDPHKRHLSLLGVRVLGRGRDAALIIDKKKRAGQIIDEIVIAMPSASGTQMGEALANCRAAGVPCKTIPGLGELLRGKVLSAQIRDISVNDLLGREPVQLEEERIRQTLRARVVLVTGGAGSIGSEICRQVARFEPQAVIIFDQAESELYRIEQELHRTLPSVNVVAELGDMRDPVRIDEVFHRHQVNSVFHAAAYKHVPMMEAHVLEAATNNVVGTWNIVQAAHRYKVPDFLMISSDKAVNPTSIMGVTKRIAELIVSSMPASEGGTKFVSVRFGNVLGSNGSVVPLFKEQIAAGGPVTVTHPNMRRYFMTIREAVQLVLQASTMGKGSEIFVLDMGEPVRILDLARTLIRLSGLVPDEDIEIRFTGLRPGEKLFEEIMIEGENIQPTYHSKIRIFQGPRPAHAAIQSWIVELQRLIDARNERGVLSHITSLVPEYQGKKGMMSAQPTLSMSAAAAV